MNDALGMRRGEHVEELVGDLEDLAQLKRIRGRLRVALERVAVEQLHHEVRRPVLGVRVVEDTDHAWVLDLVREVALPQEARHQPRIGDELRVEHLQCRALAVAMGRPVDRCHAADPEQRIDPPLLVQQRSHARPSALGCDRGERHGLAESYRRPWQRRK